MSPKSDESKMSKGNESNLNIRGLLNKLPFRKKNKQNKQQFLSSHNVFDALPDISLPEKNDSVCDPDNEDLKEDTSTYENDTHAYDKKYDNNFPCENSENTGNKFFQSNDKRKRSKGTQSKRNAHTKGTCVQSNQTTIIVNDGTGIHIGNNNIYNFHYGKTKKQKQTNMTEDVIEILNCNDKIEPCHLDMLACHFGHKWVDIGADLNITTAELQSIMKKYTSCKEAAYHMLKLWWNQQGGSATVGQLCSLLWKRNIATAREAVHELSKRIEDIRD